MKAIKLQVRISEETNRQLQNAAAYYDMTVSELLRRLIIKFLMGEIDIL